MIPRDVRRRLRVEPGDSLVLTEEDGGIRLRPLADRIDALQGSWSDLAPGVSLADELIAERRAEAARE